MKQPKVTGDPTMTISMPLDLATKLAVHAVKEKVTQSEILDQMIPTYLQKAKLAQMPKGTRLQRPATGTGDARLRRYWLDPATLDLLAEAEDMGYSRSFIVEEAVKAGLR